MSSDRHQRTVLVCLSVMFLILATPLCAATRTWTGTSSGAWSVGANWGGTAPIAGDDLVFPNVSTTTSLNNDLPAGTTFHSITITSSTYFFSGNGITLDSGGLISTSTAAATIAFPVTLAAPQTWNLVANANAGITFNPTAALNLGANALTITGSGRHTFNSNTISGTGGITLTGTIAMDFDFCNINNSGGVNVNANAHFIGTAPSATGPVNFNSGGQLDVPIGFYPFLKDVSFNAGSTYNVILNGPSLSQQTRTTANGNLFMAGNLSVTRGFTAPGGTQFTILLHQISGTVSGTFAGLPEGSIINVSGQNYGISYVGGSGDDVTLTAQTFVGVSGDANGDGLVTVADVFYLINNLFTGGPAPLGPADANGDGNVTAADIFYLINFLFAGGPAPV